MTIKSKNNNEIIELFHDVFNNLTEQEKLENDAKLLMFRFLEIIEKKRKDLGWTRKQLAEKVGTSASYITQLFQGDKLINMMTLAKMKKVLEIEFEIAEHVAYQEQVKSYSPVGDGKGVWVYRNFMYPDYESHERITKIPKKEERVA